MSRAPARSARRSGARLRWAIFAIACFAALAALGWVTRSVMALERNEAIARAETSRAEKVRLALWRVDSWMAPRLAAEAARPYFHYLALYPPRRAYDQYLSPIAAGEVLTPSPLLGFSDDVVKLHVQVDATGRITSPQAPEGAPWSEQVAPMVPPDRVIAVAGLLQRARADLAELPLIRRVLEVVSCQTAEIVEDPRNDTPFVNEMLSKLNRGQSQWSTSAAQGSLGDAEAPEREYVMVQVPPVFDAAVSASKQVAVAKAPASPTPVSPAPVKSPVPTAKTSPTAPPAKDAPLADRSADRPSNAPTRAAADRKSVAPQQQRELVDNDYTQRLIQSNAAQVAAPVQVEASPGDPVVEVGPFVPLWVEQSDGPPSLYYFRRVAVGSAELAQGFLVDWPTLATLLQTQVKDLLPLATVEPISVGAGPRQEPLPPPMLAPSESPALGASVLPVPALPETVLPAAKFASSAHELEQTRLASIPARLVPGPADATAMPSGLTPARATLGAAWLALLAAIGAAGFSLWAVSADAARRTRFAGVVTHELRTPLTTFQLYTDMLVDDMVPPERRGEYLATLRDESHRLGHLVENVLSYAQIEQGRHAARLEPTTAAALIGRIEAPLRRRAESAGLTLRVEQEVAELDRSFRVDVESVERILFNLVDNAAKYAARHTASPAEDVAVDSSASARADLVLRVEQSGDELHLALVDHGPGVPPAQRARLFRPFERGGDDHTQQQRGIGLGLALSRELARAIGGDLRHEPTPGGGATFRLVVVG